MSETIADTKELKRREFILNGNLWRVVLSISLPLIVMNAFNYLYGLIDTIMVANISSTAVSAVTVLDQIKNMLSSLGSGLATGGTVLIARSIGAKNYDRAKKLSSTMLIIAATVGVGLAAVVIPLAKPILRLLQTPESLIDVGANYFALQIVTVAIVVINSVYLGLEKARGETKTILYLNILVMLVKIGLTAVFLYVFNITDIMYVALATLIANLGLSVYVIFRISSKNYIFRFSFENADKTKGTVKNVFKVSIPIWLGKFVFSLGKVVINAMCGHYGDTVSGALGVSNHLGGSVTNITSSIEESESAIVSQNLGNDNPKRAVKAFWYSLIINLSIAAVGVALLTIFNDEVIGFFAKDDAEFFEMISKIFRFEKVGIMALAVNSAVLGLLYGFGYTKTTLVLNLSRLFVFRIPSLYILMNFTSLGVESVGIAMMISNCGIGIMAFIVGLVYLVKINNDIKAKEAQSAEKEE